MMTSQRVELQGAPEGNMKVTYDQEVDILRIILNGEDIEESDGDKPGVIIDYDGQGNVVGLEVLDASTRIADPRTLEYAVTGKSGDRQRVSAIKGEHRNG